MTTPREHADPAVRYFMDNTLTCWARNKGSSDTEWYVAPNPRFNMSDLEYYVGHEPPPPVKRTITLTVNGRELVLPAPLKGPLPAGRAYYVVGEDGRPILRVWANTDFDRLCQSKLRMHSTEVDARAWSDFDQWCRGGG